MNTTYGFLTVLLRTTTDAIVPIQLKNITLQIVGYTKKTTFKQVKMNGWTQSQFHGLVHREEQTRDMH